jgi:hypothetical protein
MINSIRHIKSDAIVAIDIETTRLRGTFSQLPESFQEAWEYKNKHEGEIPDLEDLEKKWTQHASLYAEFSKVCAVSIAYVSKGKVKVKNYAGNSEKLILMELAKDLNLFWEKDYRLCAHAGNYFDYPFLAKRYVINFLEIPYLIDTSQQKPWEKRNLDTNEIWKSFGTGPGSSLIALCAALNIPSPKVDLVGDEVGKAYFTGEYTRIADYCNLDAITCLNVFRRFKGEEIFSFEEAIYVNQGKLLTNEGFLTNIHKTKQLTEQDKFKIQDFCKGLTFDEVEKVRDILEAALQVGGKLPNEVKDFLEKL